MRDCSSPKTPAQLNPASNRRSLYWTIRFSLSLSLSLSLFRRLASLFFSSLSLSLSLSLDALLRARYVWLSLVEGGSDGEQGVWVGNSVGNSDELRNSEVW